MHSRQMLTGVVVLVVCGCSLWMITRVRAAGKSLEPVMSVRLAGPTAGICADGDDLVVLDASGTRLLILDSLLSPKDTIPLTERLAAPRRVAADRFYYYVSDDQVLYRLPKRDLKLATWLSRVRVSGLANFAPGEMLISDEERSTVWYKALFGESRRFLDVASVRRPGPIAVLSDGGFCLLDARDQLVYFNRVGVVTRRAGLGGGYDFLAADRDGSIYLSGVGTNTITRMSGDSQLRFDLSGVKSVAGIALLTGGLAVLDANSTIQLYRLP